jgi:hypothetical protein
MKEDILCNDMQTTLKHEKAILQYHRMPEVCSILLQLHPTQPREKHIQSLDVDVEQRRYID